MNTRANPEQRAGAAGLTPSDGARRNITSAPPLFTLASS